MGTSRCNRVVVSGFAGPGPAEGGPYECTLPPRMQNGVSAFVEGGDAASASNQIAPHVSWSLAGFAERPAGPPLYSDLHGSIPRRLRLARPGPRDARWRRDGRRLPGGGHRAQAPRGTQVPDSGCLRRGRRPGAAAARGARRLVAHPSAHLHGVRNWRARRHTAESLAQGRRCYEEAIAMDPL
jgi:hypothetical protein